MDRAERRRRTEVVIKKRKNLLSNISTCVFKPKSIADCALSPIERGDICEGQLRNNNEMNKYTNAGTAKKTKTKHGHASYRHKGAYGSAINYAPKEQRQVDEFENQLGEYYGK